MTWAVDLSWIVAAAAIVVAGAALIVLRRPGLGLHALLDLLLAAGLLRLSADATWRAIVVAAVIVVLRRLLVTAINANSTAATKHPHRSLPLGNLRSRNPATTQEAPDGPRPHRDRR